MAKVTISIDDQLAQAVRQEARVCNLSTSEFVSGILAYALWRKAQADASSARFPTITGVHIRPGVDLDQPRAPATKTSEAPLAYALRTTVF